ncbi:hypothetical protein [Streptomyces sp. NPDC088727]|uniref:hypothetical protein n=1 Tax=Streptomyces sp. NPDC088727 TaxID=3365875 RepID=UPI0037FCF8E4
MKRTRAFTTVAAALVAGLLAGASGCTSTSDGPARSGMPKTAEPSAKTGTERISAPDNQACEGGTYTWFNLQRHSVLNGVTKAQRVTAKPARMTEPMQRLRTDQASFQSDGPTLDSKDVFLALSVHLGFAEKGDDADGGAGLGEPGEYAAVDEGGGEVSGRVARLVNFSSVSLVETDFRYTCPGVAASQPTTGHVVTWTGEGGGTIDCAMSLPKRASAAAHEAVRLSCGR